MKKLLVIAFAFALSLFSIQTKAQTIQNATITTPILCYGDLANINIVVNQTTPPTLLKVVVGYQLFGGFIPITSTNNTTVTNINVPGLAAQNYIIRLVDSVAYYATNPNGSNPSSIYDDTSINITQPLQLSNTAIQSGPLLCFGDCNASVTINILGGTPPYTMSFGSGSNVTLPLTTFDSVYTNLCAGSYPISVTDANSCNVSSSSPTSITILDPPELDPQGFVSSNYTGQDVSCFGAVDGEITGFVTGGTPPYAFSLDGITYGNNSIFSGLGSGTYTIYYRDANGCDTLETITINDPPALSGAVSITQQVSCFGVCDGILTFQVDNILVGTPPYTYSISGGAFQNSSSFSGLCGNTTYSITVKDANGCTYNANKFLPEPSQITFSDSTSNYNGFNISCFGLSDGSIHISNVSGGNLPYTYSIDGTTFSSAMNYTGLSAGNYLVSVKDANGCVSSTSISLNEPLPFSINYNIDSVISCPGVCNGSISVSPTNGVMPILYDLTGYPTQTSQSWTGMCGDITFGSYTLNAVDANGCSSSTTISLTEPLPFVYTVDSVTETCNLVNGSASISVTQGGTPPYAYLWDDPAAQITATATSLATGLYWVRVTDANGCEFVEDVFVDEADITLTFDSIPPCNNANDGSATVNPSGTPPYNILWETGETTNTITGLAAGFYTVTVSDHTGCSVTDSVEVPSTATVTISLDVANSTLNVLCNGFPSDTIIVNASGGTGPNTYQYNIPGVFPTPQYNNVFSGLYAGTYPVVAVDANGCSDTIDVTITHPDVIYFSATSSDVSCDGGSNGSIWVDSISGGTPPYSYSWNTGQNTANVNNLTAGTYTLTVTDMYGCASNPSQVTVTVSEPAQLTSSTNIINHSSCAGTQTAANGEAEVIASGGTPGYTYSWSTGANSSNISLLLPGIYSVQIIDVNGCMITDSLEILAGENPVLDVTVQNVSCFGANDGMMTTSATLGTPPYQFSSDGGNTFVPLGTPFGPSGQAAYFITVVDSEGCTDSDSIFVNEPDELLISSLTVQNVLCYDSANGQITANPTGGTGNYAYLWNDGQTTQTAVGLIPSTYSVQITDSSGCSTTSSNQTITQPDSLYISSFTLTHVSCNGGNDGSVLVMVNGGTQSYSYNWSGGSDMNLSAGTYTSTITDANGCVTSSDFTITEPSQMAVQFIRDSVTCVGGSDGMATAIVTGGTGSHSLLWENGSSSNMINTLTAGYHTLSVTDDNGCVFIDSVEILEPSHSIEIDSLIVSEITCNNANNGSITVLATGGQLPYVYSNTNGVFTQNNIGFVNLSPNQYIMHVEDNRGCIDRDTVVLNQPDSIYIDTTIFSHISCYDSNDGSIQAIHAYGGTPLIDFNGNPHYLYSVNGGANHHNMAHFHSYGPGTYTVQVIDANNCSAQDIIIIEEPDELDVTITTSMWNGYEIRCYGQSSGYADILISGGNGPYIKTVLDGGMNGTTFYNGTSNNITGLSAGLYGFIVTDNNGCPYEEELTYHQPTQLVVDTFIIDHVTCDGWTNGSITSVIDGGVGSATTYSYAWSTGDSSYTIHNLGVGNYNLTVTDQNNCILDTVAEIDGSNALSATIGNTEDPSCWMYCDGEIEIIASGGVPNINSLGNSIYSYQWDDTLGQTTATAIGLCVDGVLNTDIFTCVITDALGCTTSQSYTLNQPEKLEVSIQQNSYLYCFGDATASLSASVDIGTTGGPTGTPPYDFTWNTGALGSSLGGLSAGAYVVIVEDNNLCTDTTDFTITEPSMLQAHIDINDIIDVDCYGSSSGEITVTVMGGTTDFNTQYSYSWNPSNVGNVSTNFDFPTLTGTSTLSDVSIGVYYVNVTDINGCSVTSNIEYVDQPTDPLSIFTDSTDETCNLGDGTATALVLGGTHPYTFDWGNGSPNTPTGTSDQIGELKSGIYTVTVTDSNGCIISGSTEVVGVKNIFLPNNDTSMSETICLGESVYLNIEDRGYIYQWSTGETDPSITVYPEDPITHYILTITEPGCSPYTVTASIDVLKLDINPVANPNPLVLGEQVTIESSYSYDSYQWVWNNYQDTAIGMSMTDYPEESQWYYVEVTDYDGCKGIDSIYVVVGAVPYDAISPNGDGLNDEWEILDIERYPDAEIQIFNRWGSLIYSASGGDYNDNKWRGEFENNPLPVGTYYYTINLNDGSDLQTGAVTIVR